VAREALNPSPRGITLGEDVHSVFISLLLFAQAASPAAQSPAGAPADWDMRPRIEKLGQNVGRLKPVFDQIKPGSWTIEGGPEAYQRQQKACADGLTYVQNAVTRWSAQPDKLSLMLETLIRIESMDQQAISLSQGVRRYQNPAVADILDSMLNSLSGDLEWLRAQSLEMAQQREKELEVAQKEAQRCRTQILQPHSPKN
jgi:hypothetical protein